MALKTIIASLALALAVPAFAGAAESRERVVEVVAATLYHEARGEGGKGVEAVASVIYNRARQKRWRKLGVVGVCLQRKQFSCFNAGFRVPAPKTPADRAALKNCIVVAERIADGKFAPLHAGNHYCTVSCAVSWKAQLKNPVRIGRHVFGTL